MRTMKAAVLYDSRTPMVIEEVQLDDPGPNEVLVQVAAGGVCRTDLHVLKGEWTARFPIVLGHEAAGAVAAVGAGVTRVRPGDPVVLTFKPHCGYCEPCMSGRPHLCAGLGGPGGTLPGGHTRLSKGGQPIHHFARTAAFAEYAVLHESSVVLIGPATPMEVAALVGCSVTTGVGAVLNTARVRPGSTVAVIGCGGVGLNVIQGARLANAGRIIAVDVSQEKLEFAERFGATDTVDAREASPVDAIRRLTGGGADYTFEALGSAETIRTAFEAVRTGGTATVVGMAPVGEYAQIDAFALAVQEKTLQGSFYGSARTHVDMPKYLALAQAGKLDLGALVTRRYPLEAINEAYAALDRGEVGRGVIVF
jgi:S-(hydroxymethyl)glutathione dehydrogenase/alcohol dehydrogenase